MKDLISQLRGAILATVILTVACCGLYPLAVFGIAQLAFPVQANGSLIVGQAGTVRGSKLLGQGFTGAQYFHPRPSAAGGGYDAISSGGSNLGPTSQKLADAIKDRVSAYRQENGLETTTPVPADAVTASGSGLDPHISLQNAALQIARIAKARRLSEAKIHDLIAQNTNARSFGVLGEQGVNVLTLNLALDALGK